MTIGNIYSRYTIPPNLARHMLEVAVVGQFLVEHWRGPSIDSSRITQALLLHDMGNIVKFRKPFLGEIGQRAAYWEKIQAQFIKTYGSNAHAATEAILHELGIAKDVLRLVEEMGIATDGSLKALSWEAKICNYADTCVTPEGIVGFAPRLADLMRRYHLKATDPKVVAWKTNAHDVEAHVAGDLVELAHRDFAETIQRLSTQTISQK